MNNKEILDNAPDGATHFDGDYFYICNEDARKSSQIWSVLTAYGWDETGGLTLCDLIDMRSIADINRIAELEKENDELELDTLKRMRVVSELEEELMNTKESLNLWYTRGVNDGKEKATVLEKRIAELEKALSHAETASTKERDIRDLEQQAKGLYGNDIPINIDFRKLEDRVVAMSKKEDLNLGDL